MRELPKDVDDLLLAPIALQVEDRLVELAALADEELPRRLALDSNMADWDASNRAEQVLVSLARDIDLHRWELSWDVRGLRLGHGTRSLVLGVPPVLLDYVAGNRAERRTS